MKRIEWKKLSLAVALVLTSAQSFGQHRMPGIGMPAYLPPNTHGYCPEGNRDPRCWYYKIPEVSQPQPATNPCKLTACQAIDSIRLHATGSYVCHTTGTRLNNVYKFNCDHLVEQMDTDLLEGVHVLVTANGRDMCHKPGSCGSNACMGSTVTAQLSPSCPQ